MKYKLNRNKKGDVEMRGDSISRTALIFVAMLLIAMSFSTPAGAEGELGERQVIKDAKLSIQPPEGWAPQQAKGKGLVFYFSPPQQPNVFSPNMCAVENNFEYLPPEDKEDETKFYDAFIKKYSAEIKTLKVEKHDYQTIDGIKMLVLQTSQEINKMNLRMLHCVAFIGRKRQMQITFTCEDAQWKTLLPVFEKSLLSFKNTDKDALIKRDPLELAKREDIADAGSIMPPYFWKKYMPDKNSSKRVKAIFRGPVKNNFAPSLTISVLDAPEKKPTNRKKAFDLMREKLKKNVDELNYEWENERKDYSDKKSTFYMWIEIKTQKEDETSSTPIKMKHYHYLVLAQNKYYILTFSCLEEQFKEMKPLFDKVFSSFNK